MKRMFFLLLILNVSVYSFSQNQSDSTKMVRLETFDGNEFVGTYLGQDSVKMYILSGSLGEIGIPLLQIKSKEDIKAAQIKEGKLWFPNPQSTRYFWSPNGYGLKKGEGYYQNIWVLWNQFAVGMTDNFSLGGGIIPLFLFGGAPTPVFVTPKFSIPVEKDKINLGIGALVGTILGEQETSFGIVYGLSTIGTRDNNVSIGLGYGFAGGEWAQSPMININGLFRVSSRGYFITENYYLNAGDDSAVLITLGGRWIIKKAALDFALVIPISIEMETFVAIPWLGFTVPFGKTN